MIDTKALREKILGLAMRGKLVEQNPNDEPASELLKRIKAEKEKLIAEGKIKRDKKETEIFRGEDNKYYEKFQDDTVKEIEVPYELPSGWEWTRLNVITDKLKYGSSKKSYPEGLVPVLGMGNLQKGRICWEKLSFTDDLDEIEKFQLSYGDLLFNRTNSPELVGKTSIFLEDKNAIYAGYLILIRLINKKNFDPIFLNCVMNSSFTKQYSQLVKSDSVSQSNINASKLGSYVIPVPPKKEQEKIINIVKVLIKTVEVIEKEQSKLLSLSDLLKEKILEKAMQGKLVEQDLNDEPASLLLERIQEEKKKLYEEGIIKKKDLKTTTISKRDNSYYPLIPNNWVVADFSTLVNFVIGKTPPRKKEKYWSNGKYPWVSISDMKQNILLDTKEKVSESSYKEIFNGNISPKGTLIMSFKLSIGKTAILGEAAFHNEAIISIFPFYDKENIFRDYLKIILPKVSNQSEATSAIKGKTLNTKKISRLPIILPPIEEQKRIVNKIELVTRVLEKISSPS